MNKYLALALFTMVAFLAACGSDEEPSQKDAGFYINTVTANDGVDYRCITIWDNGIWCERMADDFKRS